MGGRNAGWQAGRLTAHGAGRHVHRWNRCSLNKGPRWCPSLIRSRWAGTRCVVHTARHRLQTRGAVKRSVAASRKDRTSASSSSASGATGGPGPAVGGPPPPPPRPGPSPAAGSLPTGVAKRSPPPPPAVTRTAWASTAISMRSASFAWLVISRRSRNALGAGVLGSAMVQRQLPQPRGKLCL